MPRFTDLEMIDICRARERLAEYRNKIERYPAEPSEPPRPDPMPAIEHKVYWRTITNVDKKALELQKRIVNLETRLKERKVKGKY